MIPIETHVDCSQYLPMEQSKYVLLMKWNESAVFDEMTIPISIMFKRVYVNHAMKQAIVDDTKYTLITGEPWKTIGAVLEWNAIY
jgi:hypothetical protein